MKKRQNKVEKFFERLEEIADYLFKDKPFWNNLMAGIVGLIILVVIKVALIGFQEKLYTGYFEYIVVFILMSILILQYDFKSSGWGDVAMIFVGIAWIGVIFYDSFATLTLAMQVIGLFASFHIIYMIIIELSKDKRIKELLKKKKWEKYLRK